MAKKQRLDFLVHEKYAQYSRQQIQSWIMQGRVKVDNQVIVKPGVPIALMALVELDAHEPKFVGRAGFKLEAALDHFGIDVAGLTVLDAGLSTGGFTDCLLQRGAKKVYGVDVGYGQVHEKIRLDERVVLLERTNLRDVKDLGEKVGLITLDLSFISILKVMDAVNAVIEPHGQLITLIKPQFEAGRNQVGKGGVIRDPVVHQEVIENVTQGIIGYGYELVGWLLSPIEGATGNKEFLAYFKRKTQD
jgi:23S rRNA (cytidine1920-2'-O)/16S rRNA (cytidine1409-2'-O)-methyltransferase